MTATKAGSPILMPLTHIDDGRLRVGRWAAFGDRGQLVHEGEPQTVP